MKARKPLPPPKHFIKRSRIKRHARPAKETRRIYGPKGRVEFVKSLPCASCGRTGTYIDNAHIETGGMSRKADYDKIIPLCGRFAPKFSCHVRLHNHGREDLELWGGFNLDSCAAATEKAWLNHQGATK